MALVDPRNV